MTSAPATAAALASLHRGALLACRMSGPCAAVDYVVHASDALARGEKATAAVLTGRAVDAAARFPFRRNARIWSAALAELVAITGASRGVAFRDR